MTTPSAASADALLTVTRDTGWFGRFQRSGLSLVADDEEVARLRHNSTVTVHLAAGSHRVFARGRGRVRSPTIDVDLKAGTTTKLALRSQFGLERKGAWMRNRVGPEATLLLTVEQG